MAARRARPALSSARTALRPPASRPSPSPSTVALGTAFERATASYLAHAAQFRLESLVRVGGAGDKGVDLRGRWQPAPLLDSPASSQQSPHLSSDTAYPVIVQCKAEATAVGPSTVRELEGTLVSQPQPRRASSQPTTALAPPHIGVLVALRGFTAAAARHARASTLPLALVHLEPRNVREMVRSGGTQGEGEGAGARVRLVSASRNRALEELLSGREAEVEGRSNEVGGVEDGVALGGALGG
ncbi:hypothetical protein DMC30DRAFT_106692 [Rhodotorula diobovata]|uniref:Restriction endonuclease type IV Mrr domain-containing protein n=1 Tax=Rhodotorula diobovata TaxID=5288 RepID=A0A5C5FL76_9BASI|nr:hypothetical protein DMC30DRAFT_106692 [Rhodotorula diobovata]